MEKHETVAAWFRVENAEEIPSPALLVYPDRVEQNIQTMIRMAGGTERLWPHVKTHKTAEIVNMQMKQGILKFKCATIAEAEMVAGCGARQLLLAIQPTGPNIDRLFRLKAKFPSTEISAIVDSEEVIRAISERGVKTGLETSLWLDVNCGMDRTGIVPGEEAIRLYRMIGTLPFLKNGGLHPYDGHIHEASLSKRQDNNRKSFEPVLGMLAKMKASDMEVPSIIAGGSPTMGILSETKSFDLSPGTSVLWDQGYGEAYSEMEYVPAAVLLMRIISKPNRNLVTIDLGTKAIASEMPHPRIKLLGLESYTVKGQWEEHMVIETQAADTHHPGDVIYGVPYHICPTVARYESMQVIEYHRYIADWQILARNRKITI